MQRHTATPSFPSRLAIGVPIVERKHAFFRLPSLALRPPNQVQGTHCNHDASSSLSPLAIAPHKMDNASTLPFAFPPWPRARPSKRYTPTTTMMLEHAKYFCNPSAKMCQCLDCRPTPQNQRACHLHLCFKINWPQTHLARIQKLFDPWNVHPGL